MPQLADLLFAISMVGCLGMGGYTVISFFYIERFRKVKNREQFRQAMPAALLRLGTISLFLFVFGLIASVLLRFVGLVALALPRFD